MFARVKPHVLTSNMRWKWFSPLHLQLMRRNYCRSCLCFANKAYILIARQYVAAWEIMKKSMYFCTTFQNSHCVMQRRRCLYLAIWKQKDQKSAKNKKGPIKIPQDNSWTLAYHSLNDSWRNEAILNVHTNANIAKHIIQIV